MFSVSCGNPAKAICTMFFPVQWFILPLYFNQLDAKSRDMYRHEIICS